MAWEGVDGRGTAPPWGTLHALLLLFGFGFAQVCLSRVFAGMSVGLETQLMAGATAAALFVPLVFVMVGRLAAGRADAAELLGFRRPRPGSFWPALAIVGVGALAFLGVTFAMAGIVCFVGMDWGDFPVQPLVRMIGAEAPGPTLVAAAVLATVGAPLIEEVLFRSVLYQPLRARLGVVPATVIVGVLFAAVHGYAWGLPQLVVLSLTFVALFERTGSLWYPIVVHGLYNGLTFALVRTVTLPGGS